MRAAIILAVLLAAARPAAAEPRRYNWELAVVDGAAFAALAGGLAMDNDPGGALVVIGGLTYLVGAPIAHGNHGNTGRAWSSLGGRLLLPVIGGAVGGVIGDDSAEDYATVAGAIYGIGAGMVLAAVIDDITPAIDERDDDTDVVILPVRGGGFTVGVAGRF